MKLEMYEEKEIDGNVIKIWIEPETPEETCLLSKLKQRIKNINPIMLYAIATWWGVEKPKMLLKFPICWEKN